jgi:hypothetical protein
MEWWQYVLYIVLLGVGWFMAHLLDPWLRQKLALQKEVSVTYLIPFKKWCHTLYKVIYKDKFQNGELPHGV